MIMGPTACPVCTLYLREGISLEEHLETHPKDQVIEAFVHSLRNHEPIHNVPNGYHSQGLPLSTPQFYELPPQCLPLQPYQSNSITYQQMVSNGNASPMPSPYVPVTMLMASNGANQPTVMQMICNPYSVLPLQHQEEVVESITPQLAQDNSSKNGKACPLNTLQTSQQLTSKPSENNSIQFETSTQHTSCLSQDTVSLADEQSCGRNTEIILSTPSVVSSDIGIEGRQSNNNEVSRLSTSPGSHYSSFSVACTSTPNSRPNDGNSDLTNQVRVIRIQSKLGSLSSKYTTTSSRLQQKPSTPRKFSIVSIPSSSVNLDSQSPPDYPSNLHTKPRNFDIIGNHNQQTLTNETNIRNLSNQETGTSLALGLEHADIELSEMILTNLSNEQSHPKHSEKDNANPNLSGEETSSDFLCTSPTSPGLRVRTDLSKASSNEDQDEFSATQNNEEDSSAQLNPTSENTCPSGLTVAEDQEANNSAPDSLHASQAFKPISPVMSRHTISPVSPHESTSCSSRKSVSPSLRIRTDLGSLTVHCEEPNTIMSKRDDVLECYEPNNSNDTSMFYANLSLQPSAVSMNCSGEYITSDCNFNEVEIQLTSLHDAPSTETVISNRSDKNEKPISTGSGQGTSTDPTTFEPTSPINIVEIDGIHIIVPRQFYEDRSEPLPNTPALTGQKIEDAAKISHTKLEIKSVTHSMNTACVERIMHREMKKSNDDTNVSTSYDLLSHENWEASDGSDTEVNADCNNSIPVWEENTDKLPVDKQYGKKKVVRSYKCIICGETFNCPKERRVHCRTQHSENASSLVIPSRSSGSNKNLQQSAEISKCGPKRQLPNSNRQVGRETKKNRKKSCKVLVVTNDASNFMGVFVKDCGNENTMEIEGNEEPNHNLKETSKLESENLTSSDINQVKREEEDKKNLVNLTIDPLNVLKDNKQVACLACTKIFLSKKHLVQHVRQDHRDGDWKFLCDECQDVFHTELLYNEHLKIHPLECKQCSKNFYRRQNLVLHMKRHYGIKPYSCSVCEKAFVTRQKMNEHLNSHTGLKPIKCPLCTMSFRRYSNLIQHKNRFHYKLKKKIKDFVCFCGDIFHTRKKLAWHKEVHDEKPKCCPYCSERFVHTASLTRHIRRAHDRRYMPKIGREAENVECNICGHVFLKSSLAVHVRLHTGEKPYSCTICSKSFATKWNLQQHRWVHTSRSLKPYKCALCKSAFNRETDFNQHMDSHRNKRPFTCNVCGETFVRKANCQRHMKEHEVGKSHYCNECGKSFHRGYYLRDHMRIHTGSRPHVCHICGKASSTKSNHNKHVKIHHAREPVNTES